jgi:RNA polymerase sigma factor (TIGR02999 family)
MPDRSATTQILAEVANGDAAAAERLFPLVYAELRRLAQSYLGNRDRSPTLPATALVHEAYLKLVDGNLAGWKDRAHFFAVAAKAIRQVLIDHERGKGRIKRWGGQRHVPLDDAASLGVALDTNLWALGRALEKLGRQHPEKERIVELRFFGGLTHEEIAELLGVNVRTVERHWRFGRAWLYRELSSEDESVRP